MMLDKMKLRGHCGDSNGSFVSAASAPMLGGVAMVVVDLLLLMVLFYGSMVRSLCFVLSCGWLKLADFATYLSC